jgi:hypothetical protein
MPPHLEVSTAHLTGSSPLVGTHIAGVDGPLAAVPAPVATTR